MCASMYVSMYVYIYMYVFLLSIYISMYVSVCMYSQHFQQSMDQPDMVDTPAHGELSRENDENDLYIGSVLAARLMRALHPHGLFDGLGSVPKCFLFYFSTSTTSTS